MRTALALVAFSFIAAFAACGDALPPNQGSTVDTVESTDTVEPTDTSTPTDTVVVDTTVPTDTTQPTDTTPIDFCLANPNGCQNGGTCVNAFDGFVCECLPGFTGGACQTNIDDCEPNPCQNGGVCTDGVDSYTCECPDGYTGVDCEVDVDECDPNPCQNGGVCTDGVNDYSCDCTDTGFTGVDCETPVEKPCHQFVIKTGWQFQGVVGPDANGDNFPDGDWVSCPDGEDACQTLTWCQGELALFNVQQNDNMPGPDWVVANAQGNNPCTSDADAVVQYTLGGEGGIFVGVTPADNMPCGVICDLNGYTNFICSY